MGRAKIGARGKCCECPEPAWRAAAHYTANSEQQRVHEEGRYLELMPSRVSGNGVFCRMGMC